MFRSRRNSLAVNGNVSNTQDLAGALSRLGDQLGTEPMDLSATADRIVTMSNVAKIGKKSRKSKKPFAYLKKIQSHAKLGDTHVSECKHLKREKSVVRNIFSADPRFAHIHSHVKDGITHKSHCHASIETMEYTFNRKFWIFCKEIDGSSWW